MYRIELIGVDGTIYQTIDGFTTWEAADQWATDHKLRFDDYAIFKDLDEDPHKTNQFDPGMVECLDGILCDINPVEIASQIERDRLSQWCETIRTEILREIQK